MVGTGRTPQDHARARLLVLAAAACFGTTGTARALGPDVSPAAVGAARVVVGALLLALVVRRSGAPRSTRPWPRRTVAPAAVAVAGYQLAFFAAVARTGVGIGTVVALGSAPTLSGLLARAVGGTPLTRRWLAATGLATAGVAVLVTGGSAARVSVPGIALALAAGGAYAVYAVGSKALLDAGHAAERVMARIFGLGALLLLPVLPLAGAGWLVTPSGIATAVYLGAVPTALAYILFARGLRVLSPGETATLTLAEPVTAAILGVVALGEPITLTAVCGAALVFAGLAALAGPTRLPSPAVRLVTAARRRR